MPRNYKAPLLPDINASNVHKDAFTPNQALDLLQADLITE
jgi:hypothetical protein